MIPPAPGAHVHLVGICGAGMAALAGLLQEAGFRVTGSDAGAYPPMAPMLAEMGIPVLEGYNASHLDPPPALVVIGNALSRGNEEVETVLNDKLPYASMPETLREMFLRERETIVVAGTHGKTTVTSILSWIFHSAGESAGTSPGFLIGGLPLNFTRGFSRGSGPHFILEGDEYDTAFFDKGPKFLHYRPDAVLLTSVEFDHADIYRDLEAVQTAFGRLLNLVPQKGLIVARAESEAVAECLASAHCPVETFGFKAGEWQASEIRFHEETTEFAVRYRGKLMGQMATKLSGEINVLNLLAAAAMAWRYEISWEKISAAVETFRGVRRRMELLGEENGVALIDDFAHHPTAIRETLRAARGRYPGRRLWALVEPRSNTLRRNVFEQQLAEALAGADRVVLAEVYRKEKLPEQERLEPERIAEALRRRKIQASAGGSPGEITESILPELQPGDVVLVMSNGAFGDIHRKLLQGLAMKTLAT
ncbi:MAG: UDP-N-acetylmuramate:L-alanyl-gamma-D-glutamyl-meso-diaminopimelate ligase [Acidobacteriota bacterium]